MTEVKLDLDGLEALSLKATDTLREGRVSQAVMTELLRAGLAAQHPKPIKMGAPVEHDAAYLTALANSAPALLALAREAEELREALWAGVEHFERVDGDAAHKAVISQMVAAAAPSRTQSGEDAA